MTRHMQREIDKLKKKILTLSAIVEESVQRAVKSVAGYDAQLAEQVIEADEQIDNMEVDVEEECLKILALYQPVAADLRFVVAALKINNDLERIGDLAVNIAERAIFLSANTHVQAPLDFAEMFEKSQAMLRMSLDALMNADSSLAHAVNLADDEVDDINRLMYKRVQEQIRHDPEHVEMLINYITISRHLERIADYATNIAEDVIYMIDGEIVRHRSDTDKDRATGQASLN
ncbi:MAG: phosphate signaling complex protein PhoU [Armatimonadota bacterium]